MNNSSIQAVARAVSNISEILERLNTEEAVRRLPVVIFILVLIIIGVFGNIHVLYIYSTKFSTSTYRIFVLSLATIDMISCCVSMPFEIADELNPYIFDQVIACKIFRFLNTCLAMATALMLVVIASERYRRICKPYGNQMTEKQSRYALTVVLCFAILASLPAIYVYGSKTIDIPGQTVKGTECTWTDEVEGSAIGYAYYAWGLLVIIICMVLLVVLYSLVGNHLRTHTIKVQSTIRVKNRRRKSTKRRARSRSLSDPRHTLKKSRQTRSADCKLVSTRSSDTKIAEHKLTQNNPIDGSYKIKDSFLIPPFVNRSQLSSNDASINKTLLTALLSIGHNDPNISYPDTAETSSRKEILKDGGTSGNATSVCKTRSSPAGNILMQKSPDLQSTQRNDETMDGNDVEAASKITTMSRRGGTIMKKTKTFISDREQRITKVLFTITLLFIFSFLPYIIILIVYSADPAYEQKLTPAAYVVYLIGLRLYLVNNVANSLLYISFDLKFRKHFSDLYKKILR